MYAVFDRYRRQRSPAFATQDEAQAWLARHPQRMKTRVRMCDTPHDDIDSQIMHTLRLLGCVEIERIL